MNIINAHEYIECRGVAALARERSIITSVINAGHLGASLSER